MFDWIGEIIFSAIFEGIFAIIAQALSIERATNCAVKPSQTEHWLLTSAMTALVAALGLLPAALATGVGTDTQRPFALVIVSGLLACLLINIFLMPALYALVARPDDRLEV